VDEKKGLVEMTLRKNPGKGAKKAAQFGLSEFSQGQKVEAVVKKVEPYGMFLQIEASNVRGLCHKSEVGHFFSFLHSNLLLTVMIGGRIPGQEADTGDVDLGRSEARRLGRAQGL
jgi:rRNA biogenesis protein RRP5